MNLLLKELYDEVAICSKCKEEYGYDIPKKFKKNPEKYKDSGLCPFCDQKFKDKPKNG